MKKKLLGLLTLALTATLMVGCGTKKGGGGESGGGEGGGGGGEPPAPVTYSFSDVVEAYALAGIEGVEIPDYSGAAIEVEVDEERPTYYISSTTREEMEAYADSLEAAGWNLEQDEYEDYGGTFEDTRAQVYLGDYLAMEGYECVIVSFGLAPDSDFPSAEIAADLANLGVTDSLPEYSGTDATGFSWYCEDDGIQLGILFEGEIEEDVLATYQADLLAANYTEAGADKYGDMHYTSPNGQIDVCAWRGSDIGYSGYIFVDIAVIE